jgi:hypothetical protein
LVSQRDRPVAPIEFAQVRSNHIANQFAITANISGEAFEYLVVDGA